MYSSRRGHLGSGLPRLVCTMTVLDKVVSFFCSGHSHSDRLHQNSDSAAIRARARVNLNCLVDQSAAESLRLASARETR